MKEWQREQVARRCHSMRLSGKDGFAIAETLAEEGVANITPAQAVEWANEHAAKLPAPTDPQERALMVALYDLWISRADGDYHRDPSDPRWINTKDAINAVAKLGKLRSDLLGLNAPTRAEVDHLLNGEKMSIDEELAKLTQELGI